jgi:hypothetical protein
LETAKAVEITFGRAANPLKRGVNETAFAEKFWHKPGLWF